MKKSQKVSSRRTAKIDKPDRIRRNLLIAGWTAPVVTVVSLPAHAQTSPTTTPVPTTTATSTTTTTTTTTCTPPQCVDASFSFEATQDPSSGLYNFTYTYEAWFTGDLTGTTITGVVNEGLANTFATLPAQETEYVEDTCGNGPGFTVARYDGPGGSPSQSNPSSLNIFWRNFRSCDGYDSRKRLDSN